MSFMDQINADIKAAMLAKEKEKLAALRDIKSKLLLEATSGGSGEVSEEAAAKIVMKLYKQRIETYELYKKDDDKSDDKDDSKEDDDDDDDDDDGNNDDNGFFYEAEDLNYFKFRIDPFFFEWIDITEIEEGGITCGFLKPYLGSNPAIRYPQISVYVCVQFATNQPAPKGNLFVHCGGPSTLSDCIYVMGNEQVLGEKNFEDYNVISIDQVSVFFVRELPE